eukprot:gnl/MRDRNA2_/MRDRNA2_170985_c0_seq1.p1 gnl/MRDRNA2_/MRDRNA2_170985_c0~~gnl/MRDRNA2_/MRDRNA2_170985_c0_seq1.p1  ORF type:complete len:284 (-),score=38.25 gnl/MRDRNA2_/MRDRNA2_170985_c0_seq1:140-970(-)
MDGIDIGCCVASSSCAQTSGVQGGNSPILLVHWGGNAELAFQHASGQFPKKFVASGMVVAVFVDYRGYGWSGGTSSLPCLWSDTADFASALPKLVYENLGMSWPPAVPLVVMGRSIGAHCAAHMALICDHVSALILDSPVCCHWPLADVPQAAWTRVVKHLPKLHPVCRSFVCFCCKGDVSGAQEERESGCLDIIDRLSLFVGPLLVLSGTMDVVCPVPQVRGMFDKSPSTKKGIVWLEGRGHNELPGAIEYWEGLDSFLKQICEAHSESQWESVG